MRRVLVCMILTLCFGIGQQCLGAEPVPAKKTKPKVQLRFRNADILSVLEFYAKITGDVYLPGPEVKGSITLISPEPVTHRQAVAMLDGLLAMQGFSLVRTPDYVRVVKSDTAQRDAAMPITDDTPPDQQATEVFRLRHAQAAQVQQEIQPFLSATGTLTSGKSANTLIVRDSAGHLDMVRAFIEALDTEENTAVTRVYRLRYADPEKVAKALETVTKQEADSLQTPVLITPVESGASSQGAASTTSSDGTSLPTRMLPGRQLLVRATPSMQRRIEQVIFELDNKPPQILIEAKLVELTREKSVEFGLNGEWILGQATSSSFNLGALTGQGNRLLSNGGQYQFFSDNQRQKLTSAIMQKNSGVHVLSSPHLLSVDGQPASMHVGKDVPVLTDIRYDTNNQPIKSYSYKKVGVNMVITPRVTDNNHVVLDINQKVSGILSQDTVSGNYIFETREAHTMALLKHGHTLVIGGLISEQRSVTDNGLPFVNNIPGLRWLAKDTYKDAPQSQELILLITPMIIDSDEEADEATREKQEQQPDYYEMTGEEFLM